MKSLLVSLFAFSLLAPAAQAADQVINCAEINQSGSRKANGASLRAELNLNQDGSLSRRSPGTIKLKGFFKRDADLARETKDFYVSMSDARGDVQYSHVNWNDANQELVEYQLQFKTRILGHAFRDERATLVVGVENWSSEDTGAAASFRLECDSRLN